MTIPVEQFHLFNFFFFAKTKQRIFVKAKTILKVFKEMERDLDKKRNRRLSIVWASFVIEISSCAREIA